MVSEDETLRMNGSKIGSPNDTLSIPKHITLQYIHPPHSLDCRMASHRSATFTDTPYTDPNPLPSSVPHVDELGVTSAPLKSASFFIGQHCKDVNGQSCNQRSSGMLYWDAKRVIRS
jgi:hypothetical protein